MEPTAQSTHWLLDEKYAQHLDETNSRDDIHTNSSKHKRISSQAILVYVIILLMTLRIEGPFSFERSWGAYSALNGLAFVLVQIPYSIIFSRMKFTTLFPLLAIMKAVITLLQPVTHLHANLLPAFAIGNGLVDGVLTSIFITVIFSWFNTTQLPLILLLFALLRNLWYFATLPITFATTSKFECIFTIFYIVVCIFAAKYVRMPSESDWLASSVDVFMFQQADYSHGEFAPTQTEWKEVKHSYYKNIRSALYFLIPLAAGLGTAELPECHHWTLDAFIVCFATLLALCLVGCMQQSMHRVGAPLLFAANMLSWLGLLLQRIDHFVPPLIPNILVALQNALMPLLWVLTTYHTSSNKSRLRLILLSTAGMEISKIVESYTIFRNKWLLDAVAGLYATVLLLDLWISDLKQERLCDLETLDTNDCEGVIV